MSNIVKGGMVPGDYSKAAQSSRNLQAQEIEKVMTTNERLVAELEEAGHDPDFIAEAEAQMLDAMNELECS